MSCQKRKADQEERDKSSPTSSKRACFQDVASPSERGSDQSGGRSVRNYSDEERRRILTILEAEFDNELQAKEEEIVEIQERILKTQRILQYLCYAVVSDFYSREKTITSVASTRQRRIHPAVKKLLSGKGPPGAPELYQNVTIPAEASLASSGSFGSSRNLDIKDDDILARSDSPNSCESLSGKEKKVPRYIPPKPKTKPIVGNQSEPVRGGQNKIKTILVVGNVSKWLPPDSRDDAASHKWMVYVRGPKGAPDISSFVSKVRFFLHPSYRPNDVVQVVCPPFQLSRRGWGEFPIRVQVHFSNSLNKPVDIIHNLKLDRTYSGLQTLGAETVAEVWIHREQPIEEKLLEEKPTDEQRIIKREPVESIDEASSEASEAANPSASSASSLHSYESFENLEQDRKNINTNLIQNIDMNSSQQHKQVHLSSPGVKRNTVSDIAVEGSLKLSVSATGKIKTEPCESESNPAPDPVTKDGISSALIDSKQGKPVSSHGDILLSPPKAPLPGTSASTPLQVIASVQQSPTKLISSNTAGIAPTSQKALCSPSKPGTQIVKCVDSKGMVRLLQVRTDMLPKILKKGTATIPATPPATQDGQAKSIMKQPPVSQVSAQTPSKQAPLQSLVSVVQPAAAVTRVLPQTPVTRTPPQSPVTQSTIPAPVSRVPALTIAGQGSPLPSVTQGLTQTPVSQGPTQTTSKLALTSPIKIQGVQGVSLSPGARPVLRLVRPAGSANAKPLFVPSNPANQQFIRLPASAAVNGNRPLLVLKDGKLFMMKSALATAAASIGTAVPVSAVVPANPASKSQLGPEPVTTIATSGTPSTSSTTGVSGIVNQPIMTTNSQILSSDFNISSEGKKSEKVTGLTMNNQIPAAVNTGEVLKPRSSIAIPPAVRLSAPKPALGGDQMLQTANKNNSLLPQRLPPPLGIPKVTLKSGKSLLKPAVSLLKSNAGMAISSNKPASVPNVLPNSLSLMKPPTSTVPGTAESVSTSKRIILGRTSGSSSVTLTSQQALAYRELLRTTVRMCPKGSEEDVWRAVRWMVKHLPLINCEAKHPEFKILHPYCAPDEKTFCSWNIGKQRACEWLRAKTARSLLKDAGWDLRTVWTTREILLWARFNGYTPGLPIDENQQPRSPSCGGDCDNPIASICEYGEMTAVEEWLAAQEKTNSSSSLSYLPETAYSSESEEEVEIDIISKIDSPSKAKIKQEPSSIRVQDLSDEIPLEVPLRPIGDMVTKSLKSVGLHLSSEEIVPGVCYPAAHRILIQAVQSLAEDLARRALADAWGKDLSRRPRSVETSNVCSAICHRPEFDIFTCAGLGIKAISDSLISSKESSKKS